MPDASAINFPYIAAVFVGYNAHVVSPRTPLTASLEEWTRITLVSTCTKPSRKKWRFSHSRCVISRKNTNKERDERGHFKKEIRSFQDKGQFKGRGRRTAGTNSIIYNNSREIGPPKNSNLSSIIQGLCYTSRRVVPTDLVATLPPSCE